MFGLKINKYEMSNFHPLEAVHRGSETTKSGWKFKLFIILPLQQGDRLETSVDVIFWRLKSIPAL